MKIVGLIPIKLNNERMPNKNLTRFDDGTPLAQLVFNTLSSVAELDDVYCYCSNPAIEEYLSGRVKFLRRSESLDTPETKRGDLIRAFLNDVPSADIIALSHVTSPFLRAETVKQCIRAVAGGEYESAFAATRVLDFFWRADKANGLVPMNFDPINLQRSQDLPSIYKETCGCVAFTRRLFIETGRWIDAHSYICEVGAIESTDINYAEDFYIANAIRARMLKTEKKEFAPQ